MADDGCRRQSNRLLARSAASSSLRQRSRPLPRHLPSTDQAAQASLSAQLEQVVASSSIASSAEGNHHRKSTFRGKMRHVR